MAYLGINAWEQGLLAVGPDTDVDAHLRRVLPGVPHGAPVVIMIHGYRFHPGMPDVDPHRLLFSHRPERIGWKIRSWPGGLGIDEDDGRTGLAIGFAWPARERHVSSLTRFRRTGFARVYERAALYGERLSELIRKIQRIAPGRPVDLVAHSLGARVALSALPGLDAAPERIILLGAAEFGSRARAYLDARGGARAPQIYNVTARANDFYDAMFETFAPRRSWADRAVGFGLAADLPFWIDVQIDRGDVTAWINDRGIKLRPSEVRLCHWSFYTRAGAFDLYQAILRRKPGWDIASLRAAHCFLSQEPRWSRIMPQRASQPMAAPGSATDLNRA